MATILKGIILDKRFASELAELAYQFRQQGQADPSSMLLDGSRRHQVKALEGRARLNTLIELYACSFDDEMPSD